MDELALQAQMYELRELIGALLKRIEEHELTIESVYATKQYVQTYTELLIHDILPVDDAYTETSSIKGYKPLDIARVLKHFQNTKSEYTIGDYRYILMAYDTIAKEANINPYFAVAQMIKETDWLRSWWAARPRRNPAGLGVTGETKQSNVRLGAEWALRQDITYVRGYSFPDWKISAKAHIGHILGYMYSDKQLTKEQREIVIHDPRRNVIPETIRGKVTQLKDLDGKWNSGAAGYGKSIAILANVLKQ